MLSRKAATSYTTRTTNTMGFWKRSQTAQAPATALRAGMEHSEEVIAEDVEEPDERRQRALPKMHDAYTKTRPSQQTFNRRESLLTRQLHSETEHSDEERTHHPPRALSTQSTWSNPSNASSAELTSDDGISMPSPAVSPPLRPAQAYNTLPVQEKPLDQKVKIVGQEESKGAGVEKTVEATLGRKRCIMFACRGKEEVKPKVPSPTSTPAPAPPAAASPPKRKCAIKFACPMRSTSGNKSAETAVAKRPVSPPPPPQRTSSALKVDAASKPHRGSDSTVTHASPRSVRKSPSIITTAPTPTATEAAQTLPVRKLSNDSDEAGTEACRFHEFASSEDEPEEWIKEVSCHRSRLTIDDTLKKEINIRKVCEEADEEVLEDDEDEADADEDDVVGGIDDEDEDGNDEDQEDEESEESDAGFHSDDEDGFAASDSEGEDSDYEWWRPGGSTAATSTDHLDRLSIQHKGDDRLVSSSLNSLSSGQVSPRSSKRLTLRRPRSHARSLAIPIGHLEADNEDLPDSTDFVCGTLDEDRPMEQAYLNRKKCLEAAKHKVCPQDIDPTFPTSDPEMDEEDDEDLEDPEESEEDESLMHGNMDEVHSPSTLRRRSSPRPRATSHRSPPPLRHPSPAPAKRHTKHHSPPPLTKRVSAKSPPPRKLFGHSPTRRAKSPAPHHRMTSPPNTRRSSPSAASQFIHQSKGVAERPDLTHTASMPRGGFLLSRMGRMHSHDDGDDGGSYPANAVPRRGAIDIVKGLEKKRARRREKFHQKLCAKAAAKTEKTYKVKPGKGCERMREVGLQLQEYHGGKAQHVLSL